MLRIVGQELDPRLIIFDKDGTLIAFDPLWGTRFARLMEALETLTALGRDGRLGLAGTLGYDPETGEWDPRGPLTIASNTEVALLMASQLYRYQGMTWDEALAMVAEAEEVGLAQSSLIDLVEPIGDVYATLRRLHDRGLVLAVATTDDRESTEMALGKLGSCTCLRQWCVATREYASSPQQTWLRRYVVELGSLLGTLSWWVMPSWI